MRRLYFYCVCYIITILSANVNAQVVSVVSGTNFNIVSGTEIAVDGLDITPSSDFELNASISKSTSVSNSTTYSTIPKVFLFSQPTNPFSGTLKINYSNNDIASLNGPESSLKVVYHGNNWVFDSSSSNDANLNTTISSSLSSISMDEVTLATCSITTSSIAMKLANQSTVVKVLPAASWNVLSGVDASDFSFNTSGNSQELLFNTAADSANPQDSNLDNHYLVNISNGCEVQNLSITISPLCGYWDSIVSP